MEEVDISANASVKDRGGNSRQVRVKARIWHPTGTSCLLPVDVLVDTRAGGGNYASESFVRSVERNVSGGRSITSSRGKGLLRAANPT